MRILSVVLTFVAVSVGPCASLSLAEEVTWFTGPSSSDRVVWNADDPPSVCALDVFHFGVSFPSFQSRKQHFKWQLIAKTVGGWENGAVVASGSLKVTVLDHTRSNQKEVREEAEEERDKGLKCEFDPDFCLPKLVGIRLPDVNGENDDRTSLQKEHSIVLEFEKPTNQPSATSKQEIEQFVGFTEYIGDALEGTWLEDGRVLVIRIVDIDVDEVKPVGELMQGLLHTTIFVGEINDRGVRDENEVVLYEGLQSLRVEPPGVYAIRVSALDETAFWSPEVVIVTCDASYIVMDPARATLSRGMGSSEEVLSDTHPCFAIDGVLTHGGDEGFMISHDAIKMQIPGSWSLSFWVFLTEDSTGSFRSLFFNGDGNNQQRTPSAWWKPDERRIVLRVSTTTNSDVGLDSGDAIPLNEWTHMGFTFVNCSRSDITDSTHIHESCPQNNTGAKNWSYSYSFYINGMIDTEIRIHESVVANTGPLHIGKGPWTDGMQGFTSNLKIFSAPISSEQQRKLYFSERDIHKNFDECGGDYNDTKMKEPALQISYLSQCFNFGGNSSQDFSSKGEDSDKPIYTVVFKNYVAALETCEPDTWDLLMEAADLGHPAACLTVGEAYLYGSNEVKHHCLASLSIEQNLSLAENFLVKAFDNKVYSAGKPLALLLEASDSMRSVEGKQLNLFTTGLIHFAAASGGKDAFAMLGRRYRTSDSSNVEIATYHYYHAAVQASKEFHQLGKQPLHEMTRLYDSFERDITIGERGDDDELIQFQKLRADNGEVEAMAAMGDLFYWGTHGVSRDHAQAYNYFIRAAQAGNVNAQSAVAGMLLKGEGTAQDNDTAIKWYEQASEKNNTRALNGLGFIHFHGNGGVPENKSLALEYFERAAENQEDGDSIFNAGYCHAMGLGTNVNISCAMDYYDVAARKFGHFDAIFEMGKILMNGVPGVVQRNNDRALEYLKAASDGGQWGRAMRRGFDLYTNGEFKRAAIYYHEARELGYPVATSNLAFLYDQRLRTGDITSERRAFKYLLLTSSENGDREPLVRIGDYHYYGLAGMRKDPKTALRWYSRASAEGDALGAYNVGFMYEFGDGIRTNLERALRYYNRVLDLSSGAAASQLAIRFAMARLSLRGWLQNTPFEMFLGVKSPLNSSNMSNSAMFDTTTTFFDEKVYVLISTTTIIFVSIGMWYYFHT